MAIAYYGTSFSKNIAETPEGFLICRNAVIGRTGFQEYRGRELPQRGFDTPSNELCAQDLGIPDDAIVSLYRSPKEVFSPRTLASFEGKPITDEHPPELLSAETHARFNRGHIQNVRAGNEPLKDGNLPLIADLIVTDPGLISKIQGGLRELSCGYNYDLRKLGGQICQVGILGNHVAVVFKGRAGSSASIQDSHPESVIVRANADYKSRHRVGEVKPKPKPSARPLPVLRGGFDSTENRVRRCNSLFRENHQNPRVVFSNE